MRNGNAHLAGVLGADHLTLPGQTHMVKPKVLTPVLAATPSSGGAPDAAAAPAVA